MKESVLGFLVDFQSRTILLMKLEQNGLWNGLHNGISGEMAQGEVPAEAMARKCKEETGILTSQADWEHKLSLQTPAGLVHVFLGHGNTFIPAKVNEKYPTRFPINHQWGREALVPNLKWLIPLVLSNDLTHVPTLEHV